MDEVETSSSKSKISIEQSNEESEPYLGIWWTVLMIFLYLVKSIIDPEQYSFIWYIQVYVLCLVTFVTVFTLYKRIVFYRKLKKQSKQDAANIGEPAIDENTK